MTRICSRCLTKKPLNSAYFYRSRAQRGGFHPECKDCAKQSDHITNKSYYRLNSKRIMDRVRHRRTEIILFIESYKCEHLCVLCGFADYRALEFHHRDPAQKDISIGKAAKSGWSHQRILNEVAKCDLLCANCHKVVDKSYEYQATGSRRRKMDFVHTYKQNHPCACGVDNAQMLEFHHRNMTTKLFNIGQYHYSLDKIIIEIAKCNVLCANCHRINHYEDIHPEFRRTQTI